VSDDWVQVFAAGIIEAELVRALLEDNGIEAFLAGDQSAAYPVTVGAMGEGRVMVRRGDVEVALELIHGSEESPAGPQEGS
jgi:hypothetical protein